MLTKNPFELLQAEAPKAAQAFNNLIESVFSGTGLDEKTRQLIYIGIKAAQGETGAVSAHVPMAKKAGATRDEIRETVLMTLMVSGVTGLTHCLVPALETYENC